MNEQKRKRTGREIYDLILDNKLNKLNREDWDTLLVKLTN